MAIGQKPAAPPPPPVLVARLPIQDRNRKVYGYELAFQPLPGGDVEGSEIERASARVISDSLLSIGLDNLVAGHKAFVNVSRQLLLEGVPSVLPPKRVVIDLSADIEADADVIAACQQLRKTGYEISIADFVLNEWTKDLVPYATFLKVRAEKLAAPLPANGHGSHGKSAALIATGVETLDAFEQATKAGYSYFQGFFFGRPTLLQGRSVPTQHMAHLRLLRALNDPDLSVHALEDLVKHDTALCYRLLRTVNSASFGLRATVKSIREALILLGRDTVRRWAALWSMAALGESAHSELTAISTVRARCCEMLGTSAGGEDLGNRAFFVGMCSLMDMILARPMGDVLADLPLDDESREALMGTDNQLRRLLECVVAYERAEFDRCLPLATEAGLDAAMLPLAYGEGLRWSREMQQK